MQELNLIFDHQTPRSKCTSLALAHVSQKALTVGAVVSEHDSNISLKAVEQEKQIQIILIIVSLLLHTKDEK